MKLVSMTEFIFDIQTGKIPVGDSSHFMSMINKYANFLNQKIQMDMFVPVSELEKVPGAKFSREKNPFFPDFGNIVLFKDCKIEYTDLSKKYYVKSNAGFFIVTGSRAMFDNNLRIEDIVHRDLELTDDAVKLIFG